jgi:hypothetical protein
MEDGEEFMIREFDRVQSSDNAISAVAGRLVLKPLGGRWWWHRSLQVVKIYGEHGCWAAEGFGTRARRFVTVFVMKVGNNSN